MLLSRRALVVIFCSIATYASIACSPATKGAGRDPEMRATAPAIERVAPPTPNAAAYPAGATGYSISWPQCGGAYPTAPFDFGIVGVTNGIAFTHNPCFASEYQWASGGRFPPAVYWNVNYVECTHAGAS